MSYLHSSPIFSMYLAPVTQAEVKKYLHALRTSFPSYDEISLTILKHSSSILSLPLMRIIHLTLKTGIFPDELRKAKVIPLFKSGSRNDIINYRPISILPAFSNVLEKVITTRLVNYLE